MKKILNYLGFVWFLYLILVGWVWAVTKIMHLPLRTQYLFVVLLLGPMIEEFIFRYVPMLIAKELKGNWYFIIGLITSLLFASIHIHNYANLGMTYAFLIQGVVGYFCWITCRVYGYYAAALLHIKYNLAVYFFF